MDLSIKQSWPVLYQAFQFNAVTSVVNPNLNNPSIFWPRISIQPVAWSNYYQPS